MAKKIIRVWTGRDCFDCPFGEDCQYGYHGSPECGYEYQEVDDESTPEE